MKCIYGLRLAGQVPGLMREPLDHLAEVVDGSDEMVLFQLGMYMTYLLNSPEQISRVLHENPEGYDRSAFLTELLPLIGNGLFSSDDDAWVKQRQMLKSAFVPEGDETLAAVVHSELGDAIEKLKELSQSGTIDLEPELKKLCLNILHRSMFSPDAPLGEDAVIDSLDVILQHASIRGQMIHFVRAPWKRLGITQSDLPAGVAVALKEINVFIYDLIDGGISGAYASGRILKLLTSAIQAGDIDRQQARDDIATFLFAGFDTIAEMVTWSLHLLAVNPKIQDRLRQEIDGQDVMTSDWNVLPAPEGDLLQNVLFETLRLYPPAWAMYRRPKENDIIGGEQVGKGTCVMISPYTLHRNSSYWKNPDVFDPDRYKDRPETASYIPFGFGRHTCIGRRSAVLQGRLILAELVRTFNISVEHPPQPKLNPGIIIQSAKKLRFRLSLIEN